MTARAGHVAVLVATVLAVLLLGASSNGSMAALVGQDRVSATYPGFRPNVGDMATLAAMRIPGTTLRGSMEDSIEIRLIETLSPQQVRTFNGTAAIAAAKPVRNSRTLSVSKVRGISICGHPGFGFATVDRYDGPDAHDPDVRSEPNRADGPCCRCDRRRHLAGGIPTRSVGTQCYGRTANDRLRRSFLHPAPLSIGGESSALGLAPLEAERAFVTDQ